MATSPELRSLYAERDRLACAFWQTYRHNDRGRIVLNMDPKARAARKPLYAELTAVLIAIERQKVADRIEAAERAARLRALTNPEPAPPVKLKPLQLKLDL